MTVKISYKILINHRDIRRAKLNYLNNFKKTKLQTNGIFAVFLTHTYSGAWVAGVSKFIHMHSLRFLCHDHQGNSNGLQRL